MASPQKGNGYTAIAHEILDNVCRFNFNGAQLRIILKVWRSTYGYHQKDHDISLKFLQEATGLSIRAIKKEVAFLIKSKVIIVTKEATNIEPRRLSFNKNYDEWEGWGMESKKSFEGSDCSPQQLEFEGSDCAPPEGNDCAPLSLTLRGTIVHPKKIIKDLNIFYKDNVESFELFYSSYPRKISRKAAEKSWTKLSKEKDFDPVMIIQHTRNFAETCKLLGTQPNFIPHPSTYLNQKRYEDYTTVDPEGLAKGKGSKQMDVLAQFFMEGEADEQAGNSPTISCNQDGVPKLRNN